MTNFTPTRVITAFGESDHTQSNVDELHAVLTLITNDLTRWEQRSFCAIPGGADRITKQTLEAGVYHDFPLSKTTIDVLHERVERYGMVDYVPVANCGTALCVAGHVDVRNGWTFIAPVNEFGASVVIPTPQVDALLTQGQYGDDVTAREAAEVAREILNITDEDAGALFSASNNLLDLWAIGFAITAGRLPLPTTLPATRSASGSVPELTTAEDVRDAVQLTLVCRGYYRGYRNYVRYVDVDRMLMLLANTPQAQSHRDRILSEPKIVSYQLPWLREFLTNPANVSTVVD
jgi:hypothetical protein